MNIDWQVVSGVSSAVIAFTALWFSIFSFHTQQERADRYQLASVRPILKVRTQKYINQKSILIINSGVGPAIIKKALFTRGEHSSNNVVELFDLNVVWDTYMNLPDDTALQQQENIELVKLTAVALEKGGKSKDVALQILAQWQEQKEGIHMYIEYEDIYGNAQDPINTTLN